MSRLGTLLLFVSLAASVSVRGAGQPTSRNDDSCEIGVTPAATLMIPYFEVEFVAEQSQALTTLFTITNTSPQPQIARATLWTDWGFAAYSFDLFLTGYDIASVNLYELFARGKLPSTPFSGPGTFSESTNVNHAISMPVDCGTRPPAVPQFLAQDLRAVFTTGRTATGLGLTCPSASGTQQQVGTNHGTNAVGYITIDVVASCGSALPTQAEYFLKDLLYDNVLIGDFMMVNPKKDSGNFATGAPMVHLRAMPEGGPAGANVPTNLPFTFHNRLTSLLPAHYSRMMDRRQPLPVTYAARYIQGGTSSFDTRFAIWSEPTTGASAACNSYIGNANKGISELIRFDEHENANVLGSGPVICVPAPGAPGVATASLLSSTAQTFPSLSSPAGDVAGWMYMNLSHGGSALYTVNSGNRDFKTNASVFSHCSRHNQAYVMTMLFAEGRYSAMFDAAPLANGCSKAPVANTGIRPGENATP